uniref:Uncharacterized protein n=1 Tax=Chromera velia CCMP2878 TaxID=1169474 RepID=A0A0G4HVE1_9ALVE|eukprot:Cvel_8807.t1-p1 / transcript=Cvel_8807.t1 / gene=Cvel_8807 / organism=Chromera_velia_CCMP2878 / gene_product=hypothetical protein / transcript_product=hypothetical protein / location=Cvel_scaffold493:52554-53288(+) / protein_length=245 / sequence_SO=supercontig / SO=protein_coding / is_pseudo=false
MGFRWFLLETFTILLALFLAGAGITLIVFGVEEPSGKACCSVKGCPALTEPADFPEVSSKGVCLYSADECILGNGTFNDCTPGEMDSTQSCTQNTPSLMMIISGSFALTAGVFRVLSSLKCGVIEPTNDNKCLYYITMFFESLILIGVIICTAWLVQAVDQDDPVSEGEDVRYGKTRYSEGRPVFMHGESCAVNVDSGGQYEIKKVQLFHEAQVAFPLVVTLLAASCCLFLLIIFRPLTYKCLDD